MLPSYRLAIPALLLTLLVAACAKVPTPQPMQSPEQSLAEAAAQLLSEAQNSDAPQRQTQLIKAAALYIELEDDSQANTLLASIDSAQLNPQDLIDFALLYSGLLIDKGEYFTARDLLNDSRVNELLPTFNYEQQSAWRRKRADLFSLLGEDVSATQEYAALSRLQTRPEDITETHEKIWQLLVNSPDSTLTSLEAAEQNRTLKGWYNLALLGRQYQDNIRQWSEQLSLWRSRWPGHPAVLFPPSSQRHLELAANRVPGQLALLLPLSGTYAKAGKTILDGFLTAYYNVLKNEGKTSPLHIYDTNKAEINNLYQQAIASGAELVIGPLSKENIATLAALAEHPVPIIGLNYLSKEDQETAPAHARFLQFGLSVDDEAHQIAQRAWLEGHRSALIITPDTKWAATAREAFQKYWTELGGSVTLSTPYALEQVDFSAIIKPALLLDQSQLRAQKLRQTLGKNIEITARRRQDIDMIFVIAYPDQGRQIKPTLDFFYAGDIAIYATSHIYSGTENPGRDLDLEGIRFSAMPWTIPGTISDELRPTNNLQSTYPNLFALGVDAYQLHQWVDTMLAYPETPFYGHTGTLTLDAHNRIQHSYPWAEFHQGKVRLAPALKEN